MEELLTRISARELKEWELLYQIKGEEQELRKDNQLSDDDVAAAIEASGAPIADDDEDEAEDIE